MIGKKTSFKKKRLDFTSCGWNTKLLSYHLVKGVFTTLKKYKVAHNYTWTEEPWFPQSQHYCWQPDRPTDIGPRTQIGLGAKNCCKIVLIAIGVPAFVFTVAQTWLIITDELWTVQRKDIVG